MSHGLAIGRRVAELCRLILRDGQPPVKYNPMEASDAEREGPVSLRHFLLEFLALPTPSEHDIGTTSPPWQYRTNRFLRNSSPQRRIGADTEI